MSHPGPVSASQTLTRRAWLRRSAGLSLGLLLPEPRLSGQAAAPRFPAELVDFVPYSGNPVFTGGGAGSWDAKIRERGWILREDGTYKLWYTGYDGSREGVRRLGYATSADGVRWTRHAGNPLDREHWIEDMTVVRHAGTYYLFTEGRNDRAHWFTSSDGIRWTRRGTLDIRRTDGQPISEGPFGTPTVWREADRWVLLYERGDRGVWLATSPDLAVWRHVQDEPVLVPGPAEYDRDLVAVNQVVRHEDRYYAVYHGSARTGPQAGLWSTAVAASTDLVHWQKYPGNPLFPVSANKSSGLLVHDGRQFRLYTMHPEVCLHLRPGVQAP